MSTTNTQLEPILEQFYPGVSAMMNGDASVVIGMWGRNTRVSMMISSGERVEGYDAVTDFRKEMAAALGSNPFQTTVTPVDPVWTVGSDLAFADLLERAAPETTPPLDMVNRATIIFRRVDETWKVVHYHNDFINPMMLAFSHMVRHHASRAK